MSLPAKKYLLSTLALVVFLGLPSVVLADDHHTAKDMFDMSFEELMNVRIITAGKKAEKIGDIPASVVVVTREEIKTYGYRTLSEILENIPGFYMIDDYFWLGSTNFGVRGFFSTGTFNDVIILINGVNQVGDSWGDYPSSKVNVPVEAIDRIEVVRGPMSVMYGSGAFMGAINIITNVASDGMPKCMIAGGYGTFENRKLFARLCGQHSEYSYVLNASLTAADGLDEPLLSMTTDTGLVQFAGLPINATTGRMLDNSGLYIGFSATSGNRTLELTHSGTVKGVLDGQPSPGEGTELHTDATNITFKYGRDVSDKMSLKSSLGYHHHRYAHRYELLYENSFAFNQTTTDAYVLETDAFLKATPKWDITVGASIRVITHIYKIYDYPVFGDPYTNTEFYVPDDEWVTTSGLFAQMNYRASDYLLLLAGIRLERLYDYDMVISGANETGSQFSIESTYDNDEIMVVPRLAAIYNPSDEHIFKVMYGEAIKQPSILQNQSMMFTDAPDLEPAVNRTLEMNYLFTPVVGYNVFFSIYRNELDKLIAKRNEYDPADDAWTIHSSNSGKMSTTGLEARITAHPATCLNVELSGTYQDSKNEEAGYEGVQLGYAPKFLGYAKLSCSSLPNTTLALVGRYIGRMQPKWDGDPVDPDGGDLSPIGRIGNGVAAKYILDANIRIDNVITDGMFITARISNLTDEEIRYPTTTSNKWANKGTLGPGRSILVSLGARL